MASDAYPPRSHEEVSGLVSPKVDAALESEKHYSIRWWNRHEKKISYVPRSGAGRLREKTRYLPRDESEWIAVPPPRAPAAGPGSSEARCAARAAS